MFVLFLCRRGYANPLEVVRIGAAEEHRPAGLKIDQFSESEDAGVVQVGRVAEHGVHTLVDETEFDRFTRVLSRPRAKCVPRELKGMILGKIGGKGIWNVLKV